MARRQRNQTAYRISYLIYVLIFSHLLSTSTTDDSLSAGSSDGEQNVKRKNYQNSTISSAPEFIHGENVSAISMDSMFSRQLGSYFEAENDFGEIELIHPTLTSNDTGKRVVLWTGPDKEMYGKQIIFTERKGWPRGGGNGWKGWSGRPKYTPTKGAKGGGGGGGGGYGGVGKGSPPVHTPIVPHVPSNPSPTIVFCSIHDKCWHFVHCGSHPQTYLKEKNRCCSITHEALGMCCIGLESGPTLTEHDDDEIISQTETIGNHFRPYSITVVKIHPIAEDSLHSAAERGYEYKDEYKQIEAQLLELGRVVKRGTASYGHLLFFQTTPAILTIAVDNILVVKATVYLQDKYFLTPAQAGIGLQAYSFIETVLGKTCPPTPVCNEYAIKYRTADGSCNNFNIPKLGMSGTPLLRLLPPDYADGIWSPRVRKDGGALPPPRYITRTLIPDMDNPDFRYSHLVMQFGQFIDHDLTHVPIFRMNDMSGIECCGDSGTGSNGGGGGGGGYGGGSGGGGKGGGSKYRRRHYHEEDEDSEETLQHPACFPIALDPADTKFSGQTCMNFVRSMIAPRLDCTFGHADQLNQVTHWLDGSQIYGSTYEQMENLREFSNGFLRVTRDSNGRHLLPLDLVEEQNCVGSGANSELRCFLAGDKRVNEQVALTSVQTIWLREHNRVASELSEFHGDWSDELLYQESRRIVVAEYQHIVYNEWLPIIVGRRYMEVFNILPYAEGYYTGHDSLTDPTISNAFATAAFRLHTLVSGWFDFNNGNSVSRLPVRNFFNNPHLLREPGALDGITQGLLTQPVQRFDPYVTTELRDHLFETGTGRGFGMDLIALNIQRGRDHGLPGYNEYRDLCRLGKARGFEDLAPIIPFHRTEHLKRIYENVDDIDLFVGGIHETPLEGALVGPTFVCIIGDQFARLKKSDRFFYDVGGTKHSFSKAQLQAIRRVSMSRILCDNTDEIRTIQPLAFHLPNNGFNPIFPCGSPSIPRLDLSQWS